MKVENSDSGKILSIVLPCFNEEENIPVLISEITNNKFLNSINLELIFVDDASQDHTVKMLREAAIADSRIKVIELQNNVGQTSAIAAGVEVSVGRYVALMDADLQNDPNDIELLFKALTDDADVVSGWRVKRKDFRLRVWLSSMANWLIRKLVKLDVKDLGCTLKIYKGDMIRSLPLYGEMHRVLVLHMASSNKNIVNVPVNHRSRSFGQSKYGYERIFKVLLDLVLVIFFRKFLQKPIYFFGLCAMFLMCISLFSGTYALVLKISENVSFIQTPLPTLAMITFSLGLICLLLGVLAEMVMRVLHEATSRKPYKVKIK